MQPNSTREQSTGVHRKRFLVHWEYNLQRDLNFQSLDVTDIIRNLKETSARVAA